MASIPPASPDRRLLRLTGMVRVDDLRRGTASAHRGALLVTDGGESLPLVRIGGNPFEDPETCALDGRRVRVEGYRVGADFRFVRLEAVD